MFQGMNLWRVVAISVVALFLLALVSVLFPRLVMPAYQDEWEGPEATIAAIAASRAAGIGGPSERLVRQRIYVTDIQPDPSGCDWGYSVPISSIVTVKFYTFFGIPQAIWRLTCSSGQKVWGP